MSYVMIMKNIMLVYVYFFVGKWTMVRQWNKEKKKEKKKNRKKKKEKREKEKKEKEKRKKKKWIWFFEEGSSEVLLSEPAHQVIQYIATLNVAASTTFKFL